MSEGHNFNDNHNHNQDQEGNILISVLIALVITFILIGIEVPFIKESIEENFSINIYRSSNDNQIAILIALIVLNFGVSLRMLIRTTEPRKPNETVYSESENNLQNLESYNSNNKREILGVNEYGVDPTVFDFTSIDVTSLDPINDYQIIGYIAAVEEEEEPHDEEFGGW